MTAPESMIEPDHEDLVEKLHTDQSQANDTGRPAFEADEYDAFEQSRVVADPDDDYR